MLDLKRVQSGGWNRFPVREEEEELTKRGLTILLGLEAYQK